MDYEILLIWLFCCLPTLLTNAQNLSLVDRKSGLLASRQNDVAALMGKMSMLRRIRAMCAPDGMDVLLEFDQSFNGIIYSKGFHRSAECSYVQQKSNLAQYQFRIPANGCGTRQGVDSVADKNGTAPVKYIENTIIIQNEPELQEVWDVARTLRCLWHTRMEQTVQFAPVAVNMLEAQTIQFGADDGATVAMAIQTGQGPFAPILQANQLLKIGDQLTLVMYVRATPTFDVSVRDCYASDGRGRAQLQLTSRDGCLLQPKLLGMWQTTRETGSTGASIIVYAFMNTFKFPDDMELNVRCNIAIFSDIHSCKDGCSGNCNRSSSNTNETLLLELDEASRLQNGPPTEDVDENAKLKDSRRRLTPATTLAEAAVTEITLATTANSLVELQKLSLLQNGPPTDGDEEDARLKGGQRTSTTTNPSTEIVTFASQPSTTFSQDQTLLLELQRNSLLQNGPPTDDDEENARLINERRRSATTTTASPPDVMMNMNGMHPYHPRNPTHLELPPSPYVDSPVSLQDLIITPAKYEYVSTNLFGPQQSSVTSGASQAKNDATLRNNQPTAATAANRNGQQILRRQYLALLNQQQQIYNGNNINSRSNIQPNQFSLPNPQAFVTTGEQPVVIHGLWNNGQGSTSSTSRLVKRSTNLEDLQSSDSGASPANFDATSAHRKQNNRNRSGVLSLGGRLIVSTPEQIALAASELTVSPIAASKVLLSNKIQRSGAMCIAPSTFYFTLATLLGLITLLLVILLSTLFVIWRNRYYSK